MPPSPRALKIADYAARVVGATITIANPSGVKIKAIYDPTGMSSLAHYDRQITFTKSLAHAVVTKTRFGASTSDTDPSFLLAMGRQALNAGAGRCDQIAAAVIYTTFQDPDFPYHAETVFIGDHHFVVFGRNPRSLITSPEAWGDGFIVDVWRWKQGMEPEPIIVNYRTSVYFIGNRTNFRVSCFFRNPHLIGKSKTTDDLPDRLSYL